jgi:hypothetical protein
MSTNGLNMNDPYTEVYNPTFEALKDNITRRMIHHCGEISIQSSDHSNL